MGIMIEKAIEGLKTERQLSVDNMDIYDSEESRRDAVYYVSILETAIETMRKYQKIEQILKDIPYGGDATVRRIQEVIEDGRND